MFAHLVDVLPAFLVASVILATLGLGLAADA
jgi:hypothetical protein